MNEDWRMNETSIVSWQWKQQEYWFNPNANNKHLLNAYAGNIHSEGLNNNNNTLTKERRIFTDRVGVDCRLWIVDV